MLYRRNNANGEHMNLTDPHTLVDILINEAKRVLTPVARYVSVFLPDEWTWVLADTPSFSGNEHNMYFSSVWQCASKRVRGAKVKLDVMSLGTVFVTLMVPNSDTAIGTSFQMDCTEVKTWLSQQLSPLYEGEMNIEVRKKFKRLLDMYLDAREQHQEAEKRLKEAERLYVNFLLKHGKPHPKKPGTEDRTIRTAGYRTQWCHHMKVAIDEAPIIEWAENHRVGTVRSIVKHVKVLDSEKYQALRQLGKIPKKIVDVAEKAEAYYNMRIRQLKPDEDED